MLKTSAVEADCDGGRTTLRLSATYYLARATGMSRYAHNAEYTDARVRHVASLLSFGTYFLTCGPDDVLARPVSGGWLPLYLLRYLLPRVG